MLVKISRGDEVRLMLEMLPGFHTQNFVAELFKQTEAAASRTSDPADQFDWLKAFVKSSGKSDRHSDGLSYACSHLT